jgi:hypothetical protein
MSNSKISTWSIRIYFYLTSKLYTHGKCARRLCIALPPHFFLIRGEEDAKKHFFLCDAIKNACKTTKDVCMVDFQTTFYGRDFQWYMKHRHSTPKGLLRILKEMGQDFVKVFYKPKLDQQSIVELEGIKQSIGEIVWEYD